MANINLKLIRHGAGPNKEVPLNIALIDKAEIDKAKISDEEAIRAVAQHVSGPIGINIFDMEAVTTTSDGIVVEGAIVKMAAGDMGKVHKEFGILGMEEMAVTDELIVEEPHLLQWKKHYGGRKLFRGPNPSEKLIPVHNAVMTGRAVNNNSATEMMNAVTMEEILLPILGQLEIMNGGRIMIGNTGEFISVGIGMTVAEKYGRVFPTRQFKAGDTAHGSGEYAKTLKRHIPCIVAAKDVLARYIIQALDDGMIPAVHIGCSPAVLAVAKAYGAEIAVESITQKAYAELESVGITKKLLCEKSEKMTAGQIIENAGIIIPGMDRPETVDSGMLAEELTLTI